MRLARIGAAILLPCATVACVDPPPPPPYNPLPERADFQARSACLARTICHDVGEQGTSPTALHAIASRATNVCSGQIWLKIQKHAIGHGVQAANDALTDQQMDTLETERQADAIAAQA